MNQHKPRYEQVDGEVCNALEQSSSLSYHRQSEHTKHFAIIRLLWPCVLRDSKLQGTIGVVMRQRHLWKRVHLIVVVAQRGEADVGSGFGGRVSHIEGPETLLRAVRSVD